MVTNMRHNLIEKQHVHNPDLLALYERREAISTEVKMAAVALHLATTEYSNDKSDEVTKRLCAANVGYLAMIASVSTLNEEILRTENGT
jgi:hypothetical protein